MLAMALGGTLTGKLPGRWGGVGTRDNNPGQYWSGLAIYYLAGLGFLGYYCYKVHPFSN